MACCAALNIAARKEKFSLWLTLFTADRRAKANAAMPDGKCYFHSRPKRRDDVVDPGEGEGEVALGRW